MALTVAAWHRGLCRFGGDPCQRASAIVDAHHRSTRSTSTSAFVAARSMHFISSEIVNLLERL
jgi:hypothetical protein